MRNTRWILGLLALTAVASCGFEDGNPWGQVDLAVEITPGLASRQGDDGLRTASDFDVTLTQFDVTVDAVQIGLAANAGAAFDPSDPPEGYSLCHNGHCHAADGSLVDYEDIALEVAGSAGGTSAAINETLALIDLAPIAIPVDCAGGCQLTRGELANVSVTLSEVQLAGVVHDVPGFPERVGPDGYSFATSVGPITITVPLEGEIGPGEAPYLTLDIALTLPASILDGVDWAALADGTASTTPYTSITTALESSVLESTLTRSLTP